MSIRSLRAGLSLILLSVLTASFRLPVAAQQPQMASVYRQAAASYRAAAQQACSPQFKQCALAQAQYYDCLAAQLGPGGPANCTEPPQCGGSGCGSQASGLGTASATQGSINPKQQAISQFGQLLQTIINSSHGPGEDNTIDLNPEVTSEPDPADVAATNAQQALHPAQVSGLQPNSPASSVSNDDAPMVPPTAGSSDVFQQLASSIGAGPNGAAPNDVFNDIINDAASAQPPPNPLPSGDPASISGSPATVSSQDNPWDNGATEADGTPTDPTFADAFHSLAGAVGNYESQAVGNEISDLLNQAKSSIIDSLGEAAGLSPDAVALGKSLLNGPAASDGGSVIQQYVGSAIDPWRDPLGDSAAELGGYAKSAALLATGCNCDPFAGSVGDAALGLAARTAVNYGLNQVQQNVGDTLTQEYNQITGDDPVSNSALRFPQVLSGIGNPLNAIKQLKQWMSQNVDQLTTYFNQQAAGLLGFSSDQ